MFALPAADFGPPGADGTPEKLKDLADEMVKDLDQKESKIPAGYTYLGQFIDHDLTFDPASSLRRKIDVRAEVDYRTPRFDLDNVYGRGPGDDPFLYRDDGIRMRLGRKLTDRLGLVSYDVPRAGEPDPGSPNKDDSQYALIGDPRNDENVIISQLHALFLQFHNQKADKLKERNHVEPTFLEVQDEVRWHYQWVILYDFLPRIIASRIYNQVLPHVNWDPAKDSPPLNPKFTAGEKKPSVIFYPPKNKANTPVEFSGAYIPVEFSGAAYRFGHSVVRDKYRLNKNADPGIGGPFEILGKDRTLDLQGFRSFRNDWAIEWGFFFEGLGIPPAQNEEVVGEIKIAAQQTQRAFQIDTTLSKPLRELPSQFLRSNLPRNLAERNLIRGWRLGLPSGQKVATALGELPLTEDELKVGGRKLSDISGVFRDNAPLWFYILAEAQSRGEGETLGPVGSRIVMETFVGLMLADTSSLLREKDRWKPLEPSFGMMDFIKFAQGRGVGLTKGTQQAANPGS